MQRSFAEFFAGGGMVSKALSPDWSCVFANDFDAKKAVSYTRNHSGPPVLKLGDIAEVTAQDIPGAPSLIWGSSPCQDLSVAGKGAGLKGARSGTYYQFWRVIDELQAQGRGPEIVAVENVVGSLKSNGGRDFAGMCDAFVKRGFAFGAMIIDAAHFLPQSRPRLFIIGFRARNNLLSGDGPSLWLGGARVQAAYGQLPKRLQKHWIWWDLPEPEADIVAISKLILRQPGDVAWHSEAETAKLVSMMDPVNLAKLRKAQASRKRSIGFVYKRTRHDKAGRKVQRAEVRFDGVAGCLRTPGGGSSRQIILDVGRNALKSRLLSVREAARLMGLDDSYKLPEAYNEGYHLMGDGVAVPVVRYLDNHLFSKLIPVEATLLAAE